MSQCPATKAWFANFLLLFTRFLSDFIIIVCVREGEREGVRGGERDRAPVQVMRLFSGVSFLLPPLPGFWDCALSLSSPGFCIKCFYPASHLVDSNFSFLSKKPTHLDGMWERLVSALNG